MSFTQNLPQEQLHPLPIITNSPHLIHPPRFSLLIYISHRPEAAQRRPQRALEVLLPRLGGTSAAPTPVRTIAQQEPVRDRRRAVPAHGAPLSSHFAEFRAQVGHGGRLGQRRVPPNSPRGDGVQFRGVGRGREQNERGVRLPVQRLELNGQESGSELPKWSSKKPGYSRLEPVHPSACPTAACVSRRY